MRDVTSRPRAVLHADVTVFVLGAVAMAKQMSSLVTPQEAEVSMQLADDVGSFRTSKIQEQLNLDVDAVQSNCVSMRLGHDLYACIATGQ